MPARNWKDVLQNDSQHVHINSIVQQGHHNCRNSGNFTQPQAIFHTPSGVFHWGGILQPHYSYVSSASAAVSLLPVGVDPNRFP